MTAPNFPSQTAPSNIADLDDALAGGTTKRLFVLKLEPMILAGGSATLYLATRKYPGADAKPRLVMPQEMTISILNAAFGTGQRPEDGRLDLEQFRAGELTIGGFMARNQDGELDAWVDGSTYGWAGTPATLLFGDVTDAVGSLVKFMGFRVRDEPTWAFNESGDSNIAWSVKAPVVAPNGLVREAVFAGTGGNEGGADAEGRSKPVLVGKVDNVNPFPLNDGNNGYMIDPDKVDSIDKLYERGVDVGAAGTDYTDNGATDGTFDLTNQPQGVITADAKGWTGAGRTGATSDYSLKANFIIFAEDFGGATSTSAAGLTEDGGVWLPAGADARQSEVLQRSIRPLGVYFPSQDVTKLVVGEIGTPSDGTSDKTYTAAHIDAIERMPSAPAAWQVRLGYRPHGITVEALEGGLLSEAEIARLSAEYRYVKAEDTGVQTDYPDAIALDALSTLYNEADAITLATELLNIYKVPKDIFRVRLSRHPLAVWLGQIVTIDLSSEAGKGKALYGLDTPRKMMVTGWSVQFGETDVHGGSYVMECWG